MRLGCMVGVGLAGRQVRYRGLGCRLTRKGGVPWGTELKIAILRFVQGSDLELGTPILEFGTL